MQKTGEINLAQYAHGDTSPEPAMGIIRDGKYLPMSQPNQPWSRLATLRRLPTV